MNPFRQHSTLLGFVAAFVVVAVLGWLTLWQQSVIVYVVAGLASLWLFARIFYGFSSARTIDQEPASEGSVGTGGMFGLGIDWRGDDSGRLVRAYRKAELGDPSDLKALAEEENSNEDPVR